MKQAEQYLKSIVENGDSPGLQYRIFNTGSTIFKYHAGYADIAGNEQITDQTSLHAYSATKTFTALAVLQLVEKGLLQLNDSVKKFLPDFPYPAAITIRHLLTHTAGIPNPIPLSWIHLESEHESFNQKDFFRKIFEKHPKVKSKPGEKFAYTNLGYIILGWLIEKISGQNYEQYITNHILKQLEIQPQELGFLIHHEHAKGYHKQMSFSNLLLGFFIDKQKYMGTAEGKWKPFQSIYLNGSAYGGLIGTSGAFEKYIQELLKPHSELLSDTYKKMLFTENLTTSGKATGMCLSWFTGRLNGAQYFSHAGGGGGFYCETRIYPEINLGSVVMFNRTGMTDERLLNNVDKFFIREK